MTGNVLVTSGGQFVSAGAMLSGVTLGSGYLETVVQGGTAVGTVVNSGGSAGITGGTTSQTVVSSGGTETVSAGPGSRVASTVNAAGYQFVYSGGTTVGTVLSGTVSSFGFTISAAEVVITGGVASNTVVRAGGVLEVEGGMASGTVVSSGGVVTEFLRVRHHRRLHDPCGGPGDRPVRRNGVRQHGQ